MANISSGVATSPTLHYIAYFASFREALPRLLVGENGSDLKKLTERSG
jgi:hypothetical protein